MAALYPGTAPHIAPRPALQFAQWSKDFAFRLFDYGSAAANREQYGSARPPSMAGAAVSDCGWLLTAGVAPQMSLCADPLAVPPPVQSTTGCWAYPLTCWPARQMASSRPPAWCSMCSTCVRRGCPAHFASWHWVTWTSPVSMGGAPGWCAAYIKTPCWSTLQHVQAAFCAYLTPPLCNLPCSGRKGRHQGVGAVQAAPRPVKSAVNWRHGGGTVWWPVLPSACTALHC